LREQVARLRSSLAALAQAVNDAAPPQAVTSAQSAEYRASAQSLREMAVLEATMQSVAGSGRQLWRRLSVDGKRAAAP